MFRHIVHCDWSMRAAGRWMASARRDGEGRWHASGPTAVPEPAAFIDRLVALTGEGPALAAFDFPIGLPEAVGARMDLADFAALLDVLERGEWPEFFAVANTPGEVGPRRPFYPRKPGGTRLRHLLDGHGVGKIDELVRACERPGSDSGSAGCMFWTLGAKQVGKAALHGWREVIIPARRAGAQLWPFDGDLADLAVPQALVLAESYPGDAYAQLGLSLRGKSKRRVEDRRSLAGGLLGRAEARSIALEDTLRDAILAGFPLESGADDGFDAVVGLLATLAVAGGERAAGPPATASMRRWEGWILGKRPAV